MQSGKRVLVVEDEKKIAEVVVSYLKASVYAPYEASTGKEALELFAKLSPSLIILDLMLPDMTGEEICRRIRQSSPVPIIMLTAKVEEESILQGLDIGADDYVTKPFSPRQLMARVGAVLRRAGDDVLPPAARLSYHNDELIIDTVSHEVKKAGAIVNLTPNEFNILMALTKYPKKVFTRDELIELALGSDFEGYDRIIDTHIKNLRQKIETDSKNPVYILTVHGVGYRFGGE
ncbi:MAG: response regulator transcription factor [Clostridia bacterium]|nr:response regulator transcription factor [Clostridia bacterium]